MTNKRYFKTLEYQYIHQWISRTYGKASHCENDSNHISKRFEWANITGIYEKSINNFKQLCVSCHRKLDFSDKQRERQRIRLRVEKIAQKRIKQFNKNGEFIKDFTSSKEVTEKLGILHTSISNVLAGRAKTAGGFIWAR